MYLKNNLTDGYYTVGLCKNSIVKTYGIHQLVYIINNPTEDIIGFDIDHIDGNPSNNRLENLRDISHSENRRNSKVSKRNKSGVPGVRACPSCDGYWIVTIGKNYVGYFDDFDEAVSVRQITEEIYDYHENNGSR